MGGGASSATKQQQNLTLQQTQSTMNFDNQLMTMFQSQYNTQQNTLNFLKGVMNPVISNAQAGNGFSAPELAAMRTSSTDQLSGNFQDAQAALNQTLKSSGSSDVPSGVTVGADTALLNSEAQAKAGAQNNITIQNAQQANANLFNASNVLNGVAAQESPDALMSGSLQGASTVASLGGAQGGLQNSITNADSNSFFGKMTGGLAGGLAGFLTAGAGKGGLFTTLAGG